MKNSKKSELVNKANEKISEALGLLERVEDNQTEPDKDLTKAYYKLYGLSTDIEYIADNYEGRK